MLSDPQKRAVYDRGRRRVRERGGGFGAGFSFTDIMDAFFGGQRRAGRAAARDRASTAARTP